jgi:hypothetical protein
VFIFVQGSSSSNYQSNSISLPTSNYSYVQSLGDFSTQMPLSSQFNYQSSPYVPMSADFDPPPRSSIMPVGDLYSPPHSSVIPAAVFPPSLLAPSQTITCSPQAPMLSNVHSALSTGAGSSLCNLQSSVKPSLSKSVRDHHKCKICDLTFNSLRSFHDHMFGVHAAHTRSYICFCGLPFPDFAKYCKHFRICALHNSHPSIPEDNTYIPDLNCSSPVDDLLVLPTNTLCKTAHLCLTLITDHRVPEVALDKIVQHMDDICGGSSLMPLYTQVGRRNFYDKVFGMVPPLRISVNEELIGYVLPIQQTLQQYFNNPDVHRNVFNNTDDNPLPSCMLNFSHGAYVREHLTFHNTSHLQIILYSDDVELCNPLGSSKGIHKLTLFYYTLGNLPPQLRSSLASICLLAVAKTHTVQKRPEMLNLLLRDFSDTVNTLSENGVSFIINGSSVLVKGGLLCLLGDSLASNWLGGFKSSFSPVVERPCHVCLTKSVDFATVCVHEESGPRNPRVHEIRCESLKRIKGKCNRQFWSKSFGITDTSVLSCMPSFTLPRAILRDPMHLLFEGLIGIEISLLLSHVIDAGFITLGFLNDMLINHRFHYSCSISDRPTPLSKVTEINYKSSQMWNFATCLPYFIAAKIPHLLPQWQSFVKLVQIMQFLMCPFMTSTGITYLKYLISEHHRQFCLLYPNNIVPKLHFLIHLPQQIEDFGPSRNHACFRMESKHQVAKARFFNFKNICFSVCQRFSLVQTSLLFNDVGQPRHLTDSFTPGLPLTATTFTFQNVVLHCTSTHKVFCRSLELRVGSFMFVHNLLTHKIAQINALFLTSEGFLYIQLKECPSTFNSHLNMCVIDSILPESHLIPFSRFVHPWPLIDASIDGKPVISSKSVPLCVQI